MAGRRTCDLKIANPSPDMPHPFTHYIYISVIFLLVDACVGLNWLLVSFLSHVNKNIILHS